MVRFINRYLKFFYQKEVLKLARYLCFLIIQVFIFYIYLLISIFQKDLVHMHRLQIQLYKIDQSGKILIKCLRKYQVTKNFYR